ncbi:diguanylate cyclase domain-containing protein [Aliikangiella sp. G2MR2-5]|uniref:diguanylate cyclase domain-containing protein n=1 Tax=Aliikangiella sp. G2MR2-5 TaxID=2788943 RepID=UPI0018AAFE53|nr:diguanylate cyclase [Aliikangiella sp. G2MR2-5]
MANETTAISAPSKISLSDEEKRWLDLHSEIIIGIDQHWYPYEFVDNEGAYSGISADYLSVAEQKLGIKFRIRQTQSWLEAFDLFKQNEIDLLPGIIATESRRKEFLFTTSYFTTPTVIVSNKKGFYASSIDSLSERTVALVKGFAIVEYIQNNKPDINLKLVKSIEEGLSLVDQGKADAYIGAIAGVNSNIIRGDFQQLIISAFTPFDLKVSMAVKDELAPLAPILNKVFESIGNRERTAITNTWLSVKVEKGISFNNIVLWGTPPFLLLSIIVFIIFRLNKGLKAEIIRRKHVEKKLKRQAQHDPLTDLPNRRLFKELAYFSLAKAQRDAEKHAILFIDIDGFKKVNDESGHQSGDILLQQISHRLKNCIRDSDIIARYGGDEFIVLLNNDAHRELSEKVANKIIKVINEPFELGSGTKQVGASIGISTFPDDGKELESLIRLADKAMYIAKSKGKNHYKFHSSLLEKSSF